MKWPQQQQELAHATAPLHPPPRLIIQSSSTSSSSCKYPSLQQQQHPWSPPPPPHPFLFHFSFPWGPSVSPVLFCPDLFLLQWRRTVTTDEEAVMRGVPANSPDVPAPSSPSLSLALSPDFPSSLYGRISLPHHRHSVSQSLRFTTDTTDFTTATTVTDGWGCYSSIARLVLLCASRVVSHTHVLLRHCLVGWFRRLSVCSEDGWDCDPVARPLTNDENYPVFYTILWSKVDVISEQW